MIVIEPVLQYHLLLVNTNNWWIGNEITYTTSDREVRINLLANAMIEFEGNVLLEESITDQQSSDYLHTLMIFHVIQLLLITLLQIQYILMTHH